MLSVISLAHWSTSAFSDLFSSLEYRVLNDLFSSLDYIVLSVISLAHWSTECSQ